MLAQFRLTDWEKTLLGDDDGLPVPSPLGRYDAFFAEDGAGLKFTENNAETPAGSAYGDVLSELFLACRGSSRSAGTTMCVPCRAGRRCCRRCWSASTRRRGGATCR